MLTKKQREGSGNRETSETRVPLNPKTTLSQSKRTP